MLKNDYEVELEKIERVCKENKLEIEFYKAGFPIVAILRPSEESKDQLRMDLGPEAEPHTNGEIKLVFADELQMSIENNFMIEDQLLNRIKNAAKKIHYIYLQMYFKEKTFHIGEVNYGE